MRIYQTVNCYKITPKIKPSSHLFTTSVILYKNNPIKIPSKSYITNLQKSSYNIFTKLNKKEASENCI